MVDLLVLWLPREHGNISHEWHKCSISAKSLAAFWQSIYRCTHTSANTDCGKATADYPEHRCLTQPERDALGSDFTIGEVRAWNKS